MQSARKIKVAVYVITYNHVGFIEETIHSIVGQQTNFDFKIFVGDDCSNDGTQDKCLALQEQFPELIDLTLNKTNLGAVNNAYNTFNKCLNSKADYIAIVEGDDYWIDNQKLQKQVDYLDSHPEVAIHSGSVKELSKGTFSEIEIPARSFSLEEFYAKNNIITCTVMYRNDIISDYGFIKTSLFGDWCLYVELLKLSNKKAYASSDVFAVYRDHEGGVTKTTKKIKIHKLQIEQVKRFQKELNIQSYNKSDYKFINLYYTLIFKEYLKSYKFGGAFVNVIKNFAHCGANTNYKKYIKILLGMEPK